jgi:hypothetical protein
MSEENWTTLLVYLAGALQGRREGEKSMLPQ